MLLFSVLILFFGYCFTCFFFFNDTATTEIYTLSLHDALPICRLAYPPDGGRRQRIADGDDAVGIEAVHEPAEQQDRKSTRLNSSHSQISYAVFCLKKKKAPNDIQTLTEVM